MKAVISTGYGMPEILKVQDIAVPTPAEDEVLVKVHAGVVTPADCAFRKGDPFIVKLIYGLSKPKWAIQGVEFAGEVVALGKAVTSFIVGDQVFGMSPDRFGAQAEYIAVSESKVISHKPDSATYAEAVAICDGATTALTFLRDTAKVKPGQRVLVNGASGAVGSYGVQLAKHFGAHVTGVCSTPNVELVKSIGADVVIDYTQQDFTQGSEQYDVIFDAVGKSSFGKCKNVLAPKGLYLNTNPDLSVMVAVMTTSIFGDKKAKFTTAGLLQTKENLQFLSELHEAGKLQAVIDKRYPIEAIVDAHKYVETGRKKGNVVLTIVPA